MIIVLENGVEMKVKDKFVQRQILALAMGGIKPPEENGEISKEMNLRDAAEHFGITVAKIRHLINTKRLTASPSGDKQNSPLKVNIVTLAGLLGRN